MSGRDADGRGRLVAAAVLLNALFGTLFAWGLLLEPLRLATGRSLAALSLVPALALVGFTAGMLLHARLLRRMAPAPLALLLLLLGAAGHGLYLVWPHYLALLLGYGGLFGLAGGAGYGLAVALARAAARPGESGPVGLPIAAYALPGILLSALALGGLRVGTAAPALALLGGTLAAGALLAALLLRRQPRLLSPAAPTGAAPPLWRYGAGFFALACPGLAFVGHATPLLAGRGLAEAALAAPLLFNAGYLLGALLAGVLAGRTGARRAYVLALLTAAAAAPAVLWLPGALPSLAALALLGATLGSSAALLLLLLLERLGGAAAAPAFGRLMLAYGAAGLLAPFLAGLLRDLTGGYGLAVVLLAAVALAGALLLAGRSAARPLPSPGALR